MRSPTASRAVATSTGTVECRARSDAQHVQAVALGQAQVEQHQVVGLGAQRRIGHHAVAHPVHRVVLGAQGVEHGLADHGVVFDQQQSHGWRVPPGWRRLWSAGP